VKIWKRHRGKILAALSALLLGLLLLVGGAVWVLSSDEFREVASDRIVGAIEDRTGLETRLESFEIDFFNQTLAFVGLSFRGEEAAADPPLFGFDRIDVGLR